MKNTLISIFLVILFVLLFLNIENLRAGNMIATDGKNGNDKAEPNNADNSSSNQYVWKGSGSYEMFCPKCGVIHHHNDGQYNGMVYLRNKCEYDTMRDWQKMTCYGNGGGCGYNGTGWKIIPYKLNSSKPSK